MSQTFTVGPTCGSGLTALTSVESVSVRHRRSLILPIQIKTSLALLMFISVNIEQVSR